MCPAGLSAILQNRNNAGRKLGCRWLTCHLSQQRLADIFGVSSKTLSGRHHSIDINWKTFRAWGAWWTGWD